LPLKIKSKNNKKERQKMALFDKQVARKPNYYPETQVYIDALHDGHWTVKKFHFRTDYSHFKEMSPQMQEVVMRSISAIAQIEVAVKTFWGKLGERLPQPAIVDLGFVMANNEVVHNQAYEKLLTVLGLEDVFENNLKNEVVAGRVKYLHKHNEKVYKNDQKQFIYSIILFTLFVENVSLFSQFYTLSYFHRFDNVLPHTAQQLSYTVKEESIHAQIGIYLINKLRKEYPHYFDEELQTKVEQEIWEAYKAESKVIDWFIGDYENKRVDEEGREVELSASVLKAFIKQRINDSMKEIGFNGLPMSDEESTNYRKTRWFQSEVKGLTTTDFFHKHPVEYSKSAKTYNAEDIFG
jgi:ribonucleoside-diphosphate reductase beta chain